MRITGATETELLHLRKDVSGSQRRVELAQKDPLFTMMYSKYWNKNKSNMNWIMMTIWLQSMKNRSPLP
jgi:hypothetical protein